MTKFKTFLLKSIPTITLLALTCSNLSAEKIEKNNTTIELITLGVAGGPLPRKNASQTSSLLMINDKKYLIDAGDNVTRRIVQADLDFQDIDTIFITHPHSDHTLGLATLLISQWEYQRREAVHIYGPLGIKQIAKGIFEYAKANEEIRWAEGKQTPLQNHIHVHEKAPGHIFQDENVTVFAVQNSHFHFTPNTLPYGKYQSYSYKFVTPTQSIFFTGDTGPSVEMEALLQGSDILVSEVISIPDTIDAFKKSGIWQKKTPAEQQGMIQHFEAEHLTPEHIGIMATKAGVKTVVLHHFTPTIHENDDYERYAVRLKKHFSGQVLIAKDLKKFKF